MNNKQLTFVIAVIISLFIINDSFSQNFRGKNRGQGWGLTSLNLTDSQNEQISKIRIEHQENMIKLRSELDLKELELKKLQNSDDFTRNRYTAAVKEISAVKNRIAEARANHRMDIYELLDADQKKQYLNKGERFGRGGSFGNFNRRNCRNF